jgi:hypothetical protein
MRRLTFAMAVVGGWTSIAAPAPAQTVPAPLPPITLAPQADNDAPAPAPNLPTPSTPDWTFEEVLGGEVTVGPPYSPLAMGVGALTGVVAFNVLQQYVFPNGSLLSQTFLAESDLAASRIYAVGSAVAGALAGQYAYEQTSDTPRSDRVHRH